MAVIAAWIGEMLLSIVGRLAISALISLGIGFALHAVGDSSAVDSIITSTFSKAGQLYQYVQYLGIFQAFSIVLSALAGREITESAKAYLTENFHPKLKGSN